MKIGCVNKNLIRGYFWFSELLTKSDNPYKIKWDHLTLKVISRNILGIFKQNNRAKKTDSIKANVPWDTNINYKPSSGCSTL